MSVGKYAEIDCTDNYDYRPCGGDYTQKSSLGTGFRVFDNVAQGQCLYDFPNDWTCGIPDILFPACRGLYSHAQQEKVRCKSFGVRFDFRNTVESGA